MLFLSGIVAAQQWIVFFAYSSANGNFPGHTYVSFVKRDNALQQTVVEDIWDFYPVEKSFNALFKEK